MNNNSSSNGVTRRSFIKRSVVAAVAVSSMTIFSGLVNAANTGDSSYCKLAFEDIFSMQNNKLVYIGSHCWYDGGDPCKTTPPLNESCGTEIGVPNNIVSVTCGVDRDKNNFATCFNSDWQNRLPKA